MGDKHVTSTLAEIQWKTSISPVGFKWISVSVAAPAGADLKTIRLRIEVKQTSLSYKLSPLRIQQAFSLSTPDVKVILYKISIISILCESSSHVRVSNLIYKY